MSRNTKNIWCLSHIFGAWFGGNDRGLSTCKLWSKQEGGWIHFWMKRLRILNSYQIFKIKNIKLKTISSWCPFQGVFNGTTLMQISFGGTVPLRRLAKPEALSKILFNFVLTIIKTAAACASPCLNVGNLGLYSDVEAAQRPCCGGCGENTVISSLQTHRPAATEQMLRFESTV
jgi:hypothetical protein